MVRPRGRDDIPVADRDPPQSKARTPGRAAATSGVLQLLSGRQRGEPPCLALLVAARADGGLDIEDSWPDQRPAGLGLLAPPGLLVDRPVLFATERLGLAPAWSDLCGQRPAFLAAAPVPNRSLHVVVAGAGAPDPDGLVAAADLIGQLLKIGQMTGRERDASLRVSALIAHLPAPVLFVDSRDVQISLNDRARQLLGLSPGLDHGPAVADALARLIDQAGGDVRRRLSADGMKPHLMFEIEAGMRRHQVETLWVDQPDLAGRIWMFRDVTAERRFQAKLSDLAELLKLTMENVGEGVVLVDEHYRVDLCNESFAALFDLPPEAVDRGADFIAVVRMIAERGDLGPGTADDLIEERLVAERAGLLKRRDIHRVDGTILDVRRIALDDGHFLLTARDVTDEREAARFKDELIGTVSHELRTPLTAITGSLGLVRAGIAGPIEPEALKLIEVAHRNGVRLSRLVNDLLDMDKLRAGQLDFHLAETDLVRLLEDAVVQNLPYAQAFDVAIDLDAPAAPVIAEVDPDRLLQVLSNLLSNAAKFSAEGSRVEIRLRALPHSVRISVIDRGRGMSLDFRRRLFTRFAQENRSSERGQAGTGLGLAITKSIIDQHGGTIAVDTEVGVGTTFHLLLPRRKRARSG
jgi:signal transduction histidine kinase